MPNHDDEEKLLRYLKSLDALRKEDSTYIRTLLQAFNYGRTIKEKKPRHFQELAELMLEESNFGRVMHYAERLLPAKTFATLRVGIGGLLEEALVGEFMTKLPGECLYPSISTVADLNRFFGQAAIPHYFVVFQEGTGELRGIVSVNDYFPNQAGLNSMPEETLVSDLPWPPYFNREPSTIKDTDTMDLAQQSFEKKKKMHYLFVVDEERHPIGLLGRDDGLKRWQESKQG